jgi:DNA repair exonuclease SbcCD ATPase subunit
MVKGLSKATAAVQRLLDERQQIQTWLERLSMAADSAPEPVRAKVRGDYERRLGEVMKELQVHSGELHGTLERMQGARTTLATQEREAAERVAEAELRHAVGEYDEGQWRQVHADLLGALVKVREEMKQVDDEIGRLDEVMELVDAPTGRGRARESEPGGRGSPSKKEAAAARRSKQGDAFDELEFLRSVTEDEGQGPAPGHASGPMRAAEDPARAKQAGTSKADAQVRGGKPAKSLKCRECGTMNLPTEWYCERCGAELAAV